MSVIQFMYQVSRIPIHSLAAVVRSFPSTHRHISYFLPNISLFDSANASANKYGTVRTNSSASDSPDRYPSLTNNLNGTLQACAAIQQCVTLARNDPGTYYNIDIHFSLSAQKWICVQYFDYRYFPGFNVEDSDVGRSYAYEYVDD